MRDVDIRRIIERTLKHEGGFQNIESDPGNWTGGQVGKGQLKGTKFGISAKSYPYLDIEELTEEQAITVYRVDYAIPLNLTHIDSVRVGFKTFDIGVNRGVSNGARTLQRCVGVKQDAWIGPVTIQAVNALNPDILLDRMVSDLIEQYNRIVERDPTMEMWLPVWLKRAEDRGDGLEPLKGPGISVA